jgi:hypothetical protein
MIDQAVHMSCTCWLLLLLLLALLLAPEDFGDYDFVN